MKTLKRHTRYFFVYSTIGLLSSISSFAQKQKSKYPDIKTKTTIVLMEVLSEKDKKDTAVVGMTNRFNENFKQMAERFWDISAKLEFMDKDEYERKVKAKELKDVYLLYQDIDSHTSRTGSIARNNYFYLTTYALVVYFIYVDNDGVENVFTMTGINNDPGKFELGANLQIMKRKFIDESTLEDGYKRIADKTLLVDKEALDPWLTESLLSKFYKYPVKVVSEQEIENSFTGKDDKYAYLLVTPNTMLGFHKAMLFVMLNDGQLAEYQIETINRRKYNNGRKYTKFIDNKMAMKISKGIEDNIRRGKK